MKIHIERFLFFIVLGCFLFNTSTVYSQKIKTVKKSPILYEYPVDSITSVIGTAVEKPWIVYSDRNNNVSYTDSKIRTTLKNIGFLEPFYVTDETDDLVEIIKYAPDMLESVTKIKAPSKAEYYGWIQKSKLLLSQKSLVESVDKRPLKWVTMLNGKKFIETVRNHTQGERIKLYEAPDLQTARNTSLYFNELVYVYKIYGDKVLIGKQTHFGPDNCQDILLGWVPSGFVQSWGQRMCLEPLIGQTSKDAATLIYTSKEWAISGTNTASGYAIDQPPCEKIYNWKKYPVLKIETVFKNKAPYKLFNTGAITSTFDKSASYIYNLNATKINYSKLCDISKANKKVNILVAVNAGTDTREYLYALTNAVQELSGFFNAEKRDVRYHFASIDCSAISTKSEFVNQYTSILPELIAIAQRSIEGKTVPATNGIANALISANNILKGHEDETNIVIIISSKADADTRLLKEPLYNELASKTVRFVFVQPYAGEAIPAYADFIEKSGDIIEAVGNKIVIARRNKLATNMYAAERKYKSLAVNNNTISCLNFPLASNTQGFIIFPKENSKLDGKSVITAMDTLMSQIDKDNEMMLQSLQHVFNSSTSLNNSVNKTFQRYYRTQDSLPTDLGFALNNVDYNYFIEGYTTYPETMKPFKLSLLLSTEEYEDMYNMFKELKLEQINDQYDLKSRTRVNQEFSKLLSNYNNEHYTSTPIYNLTFSNYFYKLFGFYSDHELLNKYKVYDLNNPNIIDKVDLKKMIDHMNNRINAFYKLRGDARTMFASNGINYYWVSEDYLP